MTHNSKKPQSEENYRVRASSRKTANNENMEIEDNSVLDYNNDHHYKKLSVNKYNIDKSDVAF